MKKKIGILLFGTCTLVIGICIGSMDDNFKNITRIPYSSSSMIAMYIQDEDGNYNLSDAQEFPKDGYVLNTEKSSCKNGGVISQNSNTKALSLKVKTSDECTVYFDVIKGTSAKELLLSKINDSSITSYISGNKKEMFVFNHPEATQTTGWTEEERRDYRYIGNEPNNYIIFNDEIWRIIGIFTVETESGVKQQSIKIVRDEAIGNLELDLNNKNEWSTASLQILLNGDYYNQEGDYTSASLVKGLNTNARNQVMKVKWYLGGSYFISKTIDTYYEEERGVKTCVTRGDCPGESRTTSIFQNVGLIYISDYGYTYAYGVNEGCYSNTWNCDSKGTPSTGWLFTEKTQWAQNPATRSGVFYTILSRGDINGDIYVNTKAEVRPTIYLSSDIHIIEGDGSFDFPYTLS